MQAVKICTACGSMKDLSQFSKGNDKDGLQYRCKSCHADWAVKNKDKCQARKRAWYEKNLKETIARTRAWREANPEEYKKQCANHYAANREEKKEAARLWSKLNPSKKKESDKAYSKSNPEVGKAAKARWANANPEYIRMAKAKRRSLEMNAEGSHSVEDIKNLVFLQKNKCACCKKSIKNGYHLDHKKALSRGGGNDKLNLQLLCPPCNLSKNSKDEIEFMQSRGFLI